MAIPWHMNALLFQTEKYSKRVKDKKKKSVQREMKTEMTFRLRDGA